MSYARFRGACSALALLLASIWGVSATTASFVWTGSSSAAAVAGLGTNSVLVSGTDPTTLTLDLQLDIDALGVDGVAAWIEFDVDFADELDIISYSEVSYSNGNATFEPLGPGVSSQESTSSAEGQLFAFDGFSLGNGPANVTLTFARIVFATNPLNVATDGPDIFTTNEWDPFASAICDNTGADCEPRLIQASVNLIGVPLPDPGHPVPEPASAVLIGVGLIALGVAAKGRR